ncbi:hypothetical protein LOTGIDRAFT_169146 [Lottia gigantea]|uniref:N-acylethanolamine-hydrolyzing acid amidase n=1 Tax=Lottia gigantea TaxID=225164 RepID=V3ZHI7_LOTGI|nr:hypothetical protein LOTGIDRAFT_169146 [Lottia gigantea]ESO83667.1 hypothetical protein LOTGIDRAFT_169146 [Lottia gigantea]
MAVIKQLVVWLSLVCVCKSYIDVPTIPPSFTVSLDDAPNVRWAAIVKKTKVPEELVPLAELVAEKLDDFLEQPYADEMRGIATAAGMPLGDVVLTNLVYDISAFCTSITMQDSKGQIWHARNLDYSFTDILRNITMKVDFTRQNKIAYSVVTYAGYVGVLTGQKPYGFAITMDERDQGAWYENLIIALTDRRAKPAGFLMRDTVANASNFDEAVAMISDTDTMADGYFIISGAKPGEGAVVTRNRLGPPDVWKIDPEHGRWYEVETNYDHWTTPRPDDDRRDPAIKAMNAMGRQNVTVNNLFDVLSTPPVLNPTTTYSVVMSPAQPDIMKVMVRHVPKP